MCLLNDKFLANSHLHLNTIERPCRFHKVVGETFCREDIIHDFGCLELFNSFYPYYLGLIYGSNIPEHKLTIKCPSLDNYVVIKIKKFKVTKISRKVMNLLKRVLWCIRPSDYMLSDAGYEVLEVNGTCPAGLKCGDVKRIKFKGTICPATLYAAFNSKNLDPESRDFYCPSDVNVICFKEKEDGLNEND